MQLSIGQQRALFVVLVILLAGIGIYLLGPGRSHGSGAAPASTVSPAAASSSAAPLVVPSAAVSPTPITVPQSVKGVNIYDWLPFTQQDLREAANATLAFAARTRPSANADTAATYGQRLKNLVTPAFLGTLEGQFRPPGAAGMSLQEQRDDRPDHLVRRHSGVHHVRHHPHRADHHRGKDDDNDHAERRDHRGRRGRLASQRHRASWAR